ncbi:UNVERIFIED_CONTAM: hypothetical protein RMT77_014480 [Armadillidium vulgare]
MLWKSLKVVLMTTIISLYHYGSLTEAIFTKIEEHPSEPSIEDLEKSSTEFYQQELDSGKSMHNINDGSNVTLTVIKNSEDVVIKIISKLKEESKDGEIPQSFIESLIAYFYEDHPEQTTKTDFFELLKFLTNSLKELQSIPDYRSNKIVNVKSFRVILSVLRNLPKYVRKDMITINPMSIEKFLPLIKNYMIIKNDKYLYDFPSYIFEVVRNIKYEKFPDWFKIKNEKKLNKRFTEMSDRGRGERSLSNAGGFFGTIFNSIRGGGENLLYWTFQLLNMVNLAFEGVSEHNSIVSIKLFPITLREIVSECHSLEGKVHG